MHAPRPSSLFRETMRADWEATKADFRKMKPLVERLGKRVASRPFISDTTAGIIVSISVCMPIEMNVGDMTFEQSFWTRLTALPFALALSGPYGMLREWFYRIMNVPYKLPEQEEYKRNRRTIIQKAKGVFQRTKESISNVLFDFAMNPAAFALNQARKFGVDLVSFLVGQLPVYVVIVAASGANFRQVLMSSGAMLLASPVFGRPMGILYDFVRVHIFHTAPAGAKQEHSGPPQINESS